MNISLITKELQLNYSTISSEDLINHFNLTTDEAKTLILDLKKNGIIGMIYRLKTEERFSDYDNDWTPYFQDLCKLFKTRNGSYIDGSEIVNIEYKFKILNS